MEISRHHHHHIDLEQGTVFRLHHYLHDDGDLSCFSDAEDGGGAIYSSQFYSRTSSGDEEYYTFAVLHSRTVSSDSAVIKVGSLAEEAEEDDKTAAAAAEKDCRICQLGNLESDGIMIELGCSCKDDLAAAHKLCAETWFKIKGNKTCEICNSVAKNVMGVGAVQEVPTQNSVVVVEHSNESSNNASIDLPSSLSLPLAQNLETNQTFWQGNRFLNFMLACMVFAFVISWLFHFNVPSSNE